MNNGEDFLRVCNKTGRVFEMSRKEYESLLIKKVELSIIEEVKSKNSNRKINSEKVGIYLMEFENGNKDVASDRIRGRWIVENSDLLEYAKDNKNYKAIVYHCPTLKMESFPGVKIMDLCDPVWEYPSNFKRLEPITKAFIVPTEVLKERLSTVTKKPIYVIHDSHDFEHYKTKVKNPHTRKAKEVVWFGYAHNSLSLEPLVKTIKDCGLKLKCISERNDIGPIKDCDTFIKWKVDTYIKEISKCDFAVLPFNKDYKSNNKDITSYLSGIPVAKTVDDVIRLCEPEERKKDMRKAKRIVKGYDVKETAKKYEQVIKEIIGKEELIVPYTAICGGYEEERDDILVFSGEESFKRDVMNAKIYKVLSHKYIKSDISIWVDGNIFLKDKVKFASLLGDYDMAVFKHPHRKDIYEEHPVARKRVNEFLGSVMDQQIEDYRSDGFPEGFPLAECGVIIRKENPIVEEFNIRWWAEICKYQHRDQISFPYVWWKMRDRIKIKFIDGNARNHELLEYKQRH